MKTNMVLGSANDLNQINKTLNHSQKFSTSFGAINGNQHHKIIANPAHETQTVHQSYFKWIQPI